jgi:cytochrome c oxidase subunit II
VNVRKKLVWVLALLALTLLLGACGGGNKPQNTWDPAGQPAQKQRDLIIPVFWVAAAVFVIVEGGIVLIAIKYRHRKGQDRMPPQLHGNTRLEIGWTIAPAIVLAVVMVPTVAGIWDLARPPAADALNVTVEGHQWWWAFRYTDADMQVGYADNGPIVTADVMVIPVGREVSLSLESVGGGAHDDDGVSDFQVIHSFWVPRLAGKQDVVPGRTNHIVLEASEAGTYWGQCAEFCGLQHGQMRFRVVALDEPDFEAWVQHQQEPAGTPTDPLAAKGMDLFLNGVSGGGQCIACHAVGGTDAAVAVAPNLTHFAAPEHECFAGCTWNTDDEAALRAWLADPGGVRLGSKMPNYHLTPEEIDALVAYLMSLN